MPGWRVLYLAGEVAFGSCVRFLSHGLPFHVTHGFSLCEEKANINQRASSVVDRFAIHLQRVLGCFGYVGPKGSHFGSSG